MNDKFHIETYREREIYYNADTDKFTVELLIEDSWHEKSRKSLKDCRKAIDDHIKDNIDFKPVTCLYKKYGSARSIKIEQVRSDGGVLFKSKEDKMRIEISEPLEQIKGKANYFFKYDADYIEWLKASAEMEERHSAEKKAHNKTAPELKPLDLSFIKQFIKP